jgi:hypothetical protein
MQPRATVSGTQPSVLGPKPPPRTAAMAWAVASIRSSPQRCSRQPERLSRNTSTNSPGELTRRSTSRATRDDFSPGMTDTRADSATLQGMSFGAQPRNPSRFSVRNLRYGLKRTPDTSRPSVAATPSPRAPDLTHTRFAESVTARAVGVQPSPTTARKHTRPRARPPRRAQSRHRTGSGFRIWAESHLRPGGRAAIPFAAHTHRHGDGSEEAASIPAANVDWTRT